MSSRCCLATNSSTLRPRLSGTFSRRSVLHITLRERSHMPANRQTRMSRRAQAVGNAPICLEEEADEKREENQALYLVRRPLIRFECSHYDFTPSPQVPSHFLPFSYPVECALEPRRCARWGGCRHRIRCQHDTLCQACVQNHGHTCSVCHEHHLPLWCSSRAFATAGRCDRVGDAASDALHVCAGYIASSQNVHELSCSGISTSTRSSVLLGTHRLQRTLLYAIRALYEHESAHAPGPGRCRQPEAADHVSAS